MHTYERTDSHLDSNLRALRVESLTAITLIVGAAAYVWLSLAIWPVTGRSLPAGGWFGVLLLVTCSPLSFFLKDRHFPIATHVLVWGLLAAIASAVLALRIPELAYLFILPVIFASLLLGRWSVFLVALVTSLFTLAANLINTTQGPLALEVVLPVAMIATVTIASWLSARNLYIALTWVWNGYQRALQNEQAAREHQAELRRVLKVLDETNYRIERANYVATVARDQAIEAQRLKQQFAQNISHELRTPLNLIVGFTELMVQSPEYYGSPLPTAYMRELSIIHRNAKHLQTLVNDVLDLARIENAQMNLVPEMAEPASLVQEAVNTARSLVETRGLALYTEIGPDLPLLWIDPTRIRQVLFNLLNNAARFTEEGSVTVRVRREDDEVLFSVTDTGIGIPPEELPLIFQEFHQLDGSRRRRHGGAGLGLAISRRFVKLHGGRIWVESQAGEGSTFTFTLPTNDRQADNLLGAVGDRPTDLSRLYLGRREERILLVVTPSSSAATLLTRYISGHRTVAVHDLAQAQQTAQKLLPQAVIVDTANLSIGHEQLCELALRWQLPHTLFFACPLPGEDAARQQLAVNGYLIKPVSQQSLMDVLRQYGDAIENLLVIDDNHDFVRLLRRLLENPVRRYQVMTAYSGQEGLAMMRHRQPDLVLLDMVLPDLDGAQVVREMRAHPNWQHIPIVVVSGQDEMGELDTLAGSILLSKSNGLKVSELVRWIGQILDTSAKDAQATLAKDAEASPLPI